MKKISLILLCLCVWMGISYAQDDVLYLRAENAICSYNQDMPATMQDAVISEWDDDTGLLPIIERLQSAAEIDKRNFTILVTKTKINNAFAITIKGKDYIVVDVDFLEHVNEKGRSNWCAISILAHEIGHHYYGHTVQKGQQDRHKNELSADYFSGLILARLGCSKESAAAAIRSMGTEKDTDSHPNKHKRIESITQGWEAGQP